MNTWIQLIGLISAALTTTAFLPQAIKTWRTKSTHDLSPLMFTLFCLGVIGWLFYGIFIRDLPMILANSVTIVLAGTIMFFIFSTEKTARLAHLGIYVQNLELMKEFYTIHFGAIAGRKYINPGKGFSSYFLAFPSGISIELMNDESRQRKLPVISWGHIAISVGSSAEVNRLTGCLEKQGIEIVSVPRMTGDGYYESLIRDPEGNLIELTT